MIGNLKFKPALQNLPNNLSDEEILEKLLALGSLRSASGVLRKFGEEQGGCQWYHDSLEIAADSFIRKVSQI